MPRTHCLLPLLLFASFLLIAFACKKEVPPTVINGKVTDKKTGEPIEGAVTDLDFTTEKTVSGSIKTEHIIVTLKTDTQGQFQYTHEDDFDGLFSQIYKTGYAPRSPVGKIRRSEVNNLEIQLIPKDAILRLKLSNDTGQFNAIYVILKNPSYGPLYGINLPHFPVMLPVGEKYTSYLHLPSEEFSQIYWGFSYFPGSYAAPFQDSVYLTLNDTTDFVISF
jgi:hypothetical protein